MPHIVSWEPCSLAAVPDGPQVEVLNISWLQKEGAQVRMSAWGQILAFTQNVSRGTGTTWQGQRDCTGTYRLRVFGSTPGRKELVRQLTAVQIGVLLGYFAMLHHTHTHTHTHNAETCQSAQLHTPCYFRCSMPHVSALSIKIKFLANWCTFTVPVL